MILVIDAGNTNIVFAVYDGTKIQGFWRCKSDAGRTADEYLAFLSQHFELKNINLTAIKDVIICSVVPDINFELSLFTQNAFGVPARFISNTDPALQLEIKVDKPSEVGADRLVNAVAIKQLHSYPAVVIDFGTATTFDVVDKNGAFCGGVIAPGVNLSLAALHMAAAKLPKVNVERPERSIGRNTVEAMQSGVFWGYVGLVERVLDEIKAELGEEPFVIGTGGLATLFSSAVPRIKIIDEELTLKGLLCIYENGKKN